MKLRAPEREQQRRALAIVFRPESERATVEAGGGGVRAQRGRPVARAAEREPGARRELGRRLSCGLCELERRGVVVCEQLGVILLAPERLDPLGGRDVLVGACGSRDLPVTDLANEHVPVREL